MCRKLTNKIIVLVSITVPFISSVNAGEIDFTPSIQVKQSYTDNLYLATPGNEQGESVTEVLPAFLLAMRGARFNARVNYTMQNLFYNKFNESNTTFHQLDATTTSEIAKDYFFFDANANYGQSIIDTNSPIGTNNIAITGNRANTTSFGLSPYFQHSYRNLFDALARYRYSEVNYRQGSATNSSQSVYDIQLNTPVRKLGATWGVSVLNQNTNYETGSDSELKKKSLQLGYRLSPRAHFYVSGGVDENTYENSTTPDINESFWLVGTDLQLGVRDSFAFSYGERFFGPTGHFSWNHRARRLNINIDYKEEFANSALTFINTQSLGAASNTNSGSSITTETYLQKIGSLDLTYNFSKTSISVRYSDDQRNFQVTGYITRNKSASFSVNVRNSVRMAYIFTSTWNRRYDSRTDLSNFDTLVRMSAVRKLSPSLDLDLTLSHNIRRGQDSRIDYNENIASVALTKTFN